MTDISIKVRSYSGYKAEEKPLALTLGDKEYVIEEILRSSIEERGGRQRVSFTVRTKEGIFRIYYSEGEGKWYLEQ